MVIKHLMALSKSGDTEAQVFIGWLHEVGRCGFDKNYKKAFKLYSQAAKKGLPVAMFDVALLYANGEGVDQDLEKALRWLKKSYDNGYEPAILIAQRIEERLLKTSFIYRFKKFFFE